MSKTPGKPVVHTIYDKISGIDFAFAAADGRKNFCKAHRAHFDQHGSLADSVYGAVEDIGRGVQALTAQGVTLGKAFRAAVSEANKKYTDLTAAQSPLIQRMLVNFWAHGPALQVALQPPVKEQVKDPVKEKTANPIPGGPA